MKKSLNKNYLCHPNSVRLIEEGSSIESQLPPRVFKLCYDPMSGVYMETKPFLTRPKVVFGKATEQVERIIKSFDLRETSTGVILHGIAGSGKTMITQIIAYEMQERSFPIIFIDGTVPVNHIADTLTDVKTECVIIFDEFEKHFDLDQQNHLLSALDGVYSSKKLIMFTSNDIHRVSTFIRNRPSRALYSLQFEKMDLDTLREVLDHYEVNENDAKDIIRVYKRCVSFSFDILRNIISEIKLHECSVKEAISVLNIGITQDDYFSLNLEVDLGGKKPEELLIEEGSSLETAFDHLHKKSLSGDLEEVMGYILSTSDYNMARNIERVGIEVVPKDLENWLLEGAEGQYALGSLDKGIKLIIRPRYRYRASQDFL